MLTSLFVWPRLFPGPETPSHEKQFMRNHVCYKIYVGQDDDSIVLFSAGNEQTIETTTAYCEQIRQHMGMSVITYNYPGYNESDLHQTNWDEVSKAAYSIMHELVFVKGYKKIHLWGKSTGCLPTCYLGAMFQVESITLESGFTSVSAMALPNCDIFLSNLDWIKDFRTKRVIVMHHPNDSLGTYQHGRKLYECASKVCRDTIFLDADEGDHNDFIDLNAICYPRPQNL
jgi:hypothetical protein